MENKWVTLTPNNYCLKKDEEFFRTNETTDAKLLINIENAELWYCGDSMYSLTQRYDCSCNQGIINVWIKSSKSLVDVYEFLSYYKPVPTWETFVEFVKECTTIEF